MLLVLFFYLSCKSTSFSLVKQNKRKNSILHIFVLYWTAIVAYHGRELRSIRQSSVTVRTRIQSSPARVMKKDTTHILSFLPWRKWKRKNKRYTYDTCKQTRSQNLSTANWTWNLPVFWSFSHVIIQLVMIGRHDDVTALKLPGLLKT